MAGQRVNVGFLAALGAGLTVVFGGAAYLGYQVLTKSGEEYAELGAEFVAAGDYEEAAKAYGRAVGHDRTNVEWLRAWRDALVETRPATEVEYNQAYQTFYIGSLNNLAVLQPYELEPQMEFLDAYYEDAKLSPGSPAVWQRLADTASDRYDQLPDQTEGRDRLLRFRGLASIRLLQMLPGEAGAFERAVEDLERAIAADPQDLEARIGLVQLHMTEWQRLLRERRTELAARQFEEAVAAAEAIRKAFPSHPAGPLSEMGARAARAITGTASERDRAAALREIQPLYDETVSAMQALDPAELDSELLNRFFSVATAVRPENAPETTVELIDRAIERRPEDARLLIARTEFLMRLQRFEEAIETTERLRTMPDPTVGLEGRIIRIARQNAIGRQARAWIGLWENSEDPQIREEALAKARSLRDDLVDVKPQGADDPDVMLLDAQLAMAGGRYDVAINRLQELERLGVTDTQQGPLVLRLMAESLSQRDELGAAQQYFDRLVAATPTDVQSIMGAVNVDLQLQDLERAEQRLVAAVDRLPNNNTLRSMLNRVQVQLRGVAPKNDPVGEGLLEAETLVRQDPPDFQGAKAILDRLDRQYPEDYRTINARILIAAQTGENAQVRALVDEAVERFPLVPAFQEYQTRLNILESDDPIAAILAEIDRADSPPVEKAAQKYILLVRAGRDEQAEQYFQEAMDLDAEHPVVMDLRFRRALDAENVEEARRIASRAAALNTDQAGGLLFEARIALAQDDLETALTALRQASERRPLDSQVWRLLGQVQLQRGQTDSAIESLERAFDFKPKDPLNAEALASALVSLGRAEDALDVVERAREFPEGQRDRRLRELLLSLQASVGDPTEAIASYEGRLERNPEDVRTMIALANLYLREQRYEDALAMVERAASAGDEGQAQTLALLEARTLASMDPEEGVDRAAAMLRERIQPLEGTAKTDAQVALAQFLLEYDREEEAVATLQEAAETQSSERMLADRVLANYFFEKASLAGPDRRNALAELALQSFERVIEADADIPGRPFAIRRVETLMRLDRWEEADTALDQLAGADDVDPITVTLLRAQAARGADDTRAALRLVDEAVAQAPSDPRPFLVRAQLNAGNESLFGDVMKDLDQVLALQPGNIQARELKMSLLAQRGQRDEAVVELRQALDETPNDERLRRMLLRQLIALDRFDEAIRVCEEAYETRPTATRWLVAAGDVAKLWHDAERQRQGRGAGDQHLRDAADYYVRAYEQEPVAALAERAAEALLTLDDPDERRALEIIEDRGDEIEERPTLMILKARAMKEAGRQSDAVDYMREALPRLQTAAQAGTWALQLQRIFSAAGDLPTQTDLRRTLEFMRGLEPPTEVRSMYRVQMANLILAAAPEEHPSAIRMLEEVAEQTDDPVVLVRLYKSLGGLRYGQANYEGAVEAYRAGLNLAPEDLEFLNNLAFTLSKHLGDPRGALPFAERAARAAPTNANVLDTLGTVQYALGEYDDAEETLRRARSASRTGRELIPATLHLAMTRFEQGDRLEADRLAREVRKLLDQAPAFEVEYGADLDALMSKLD